MSLIFNILKDYWLYILVAGIVAFGVIRWTSMERDLTKKQAQIEELQDQNKTLQEINKEQKANQANLDIGSKSQSTVRSNQTSTKDKINNVPVQANDRPFSDPGLLGRASILRDYQEAAYPEP